MLDIGKSEPVYSADVENFLVSSRLPHDPDEQLAVHLIGYQDGEGTGVTGIEQAYDQQLASAGKDVWVRCSVDALGRPMEGERMQVNGDSQPPKQGVVLTLDRRMQKIVQRVGSRSTAGQLW